MNESFSSGLTIEQKRRALLDRQRGRSKDGREASRRDGIPVLAGDAPVPASFAQQRLWFLDRLAPGNPFYTVSLEMPLEGMVYPDLLEQALAEIARRHSALRTTFAEHDGQPVQRVHDDAAFPLERIDLSQKSPAAAKALLAKINVEETNRSFDLTRGPLAVARLVRLGPRQHRLWLTLHHIVCDGWSLKVLGRELTAIYTALIEGRRHGLQDLAVQYRDFAAWQRGLLESGTMERHRAYWISQLAGAPELAIPTDFQRPAVPTYGGAFVPFTLDGDCAGRIRGLCAGEGFTPFMVLLTAWMVLLGRHADSDDILVAAPSAGRERLELEPMIGFFVNTLVLRGDLSGEPTFREAVQRIRATCLDAFSHDEFPFDRLIEDLAPKRRGDRNPLAQVVFQLFSAPDRSVGQTTPEERQRGTSKFDLRLDLWDTETGYSGELEYSTDLFAHETAVLMADQFQVLLHELLAGPDLPISEAGIMSQDEFDWQTENCNRTDAPWPARSDLVSRFAETVARHKDEVAVSSDNRTLTYAELDRASDGAAATLSQAGVGPGDRVAVLLPRSVEMVVAWLGIVKTGAAYVPLDIDTPVARVLSALETVDAPAVVTGAAQADHFAEENLAVVQADLDRWCAGAEWTAVRSAPDDVANVMFTSGSTGKPKAVLVPHRGILRLCVGQDFWSLEAGDTIAQGSNCAFDAATLEVWGALLNGCRLQIILRDDLLTADELGRRIAAGEIDHLFLTTPLFHRLVDEAPGHFAPLKTLLVGGSRLETDSVERVLAAGKPARFENVYGPTEVTTLATAYEIEGFVQPLTSVSIGAPIANTSAYVLDRLGRLQPRAVAGELFLGGPGVTLGYLGDDRQTARKFGPSPFREGERLYATGDRVRRRLDGTLDFLGRFDDQIKLRGFRVEPDEIATALRSHPRVADAQALVAAGIGPEGHGEGRVLAFYVPAPDADTGSADVETDDDAVAYWQRIYDDVVYRDVGKRTDGDAQFDITGWTDSATGKLLSDSDMAEQIAQTCDRIVALGGRDILEFGCGTGLIVFPLAPKVRRIHGIDISERALDHIRRTAAAADLDNITLQQGSAETLAGIADGSFDTVVLNSTVQYLPSQEYLQSLLDDLLRVTRPGGAIFLGDIRHPGLLEAFQAEILLDRVDPSTTTGALRNVVARKIEEEQELLLDPYWFLALRDRYPAIADIGIQIKRGKGHNELARFRYDVVLRTGTGAAPRDLAELTWGDEIATLDDLIAAAADMGQADLRVRDIPNARTATAVAAARAIREAPDRASVADLARQAPEALPAALSPEDVASELEARGLDVQIGWGNDPGCFDLHVSAPGHAVPQALAGRRPAAGTPLASSPREGHRLRGLETELAGYLEQVLPDYMLPQGYVRLSAMPLTASGKVDRKALAALLVSAPSGPTRPPQTEIETRLAAIFCAVLQVPRVGLDDDFFRLGGHSLKATQVISRIVSELGVSVPLRAIFEAGTVEGLARAVETAQAGADRAGPASEIAVLDDAPDIDAMDSEELERALALLDDDPEDARS